VLRAAIVSTVFAGSVVEAGGQATNNQSSDTVVDAAKAVARTIAAFTVKSSGAPLEFDSATAHDNVVEVKFIANDFAAFDRFKSNSNQAKSAFVGYFCNDSGRAVYLRQGVVMHYVYARSDDTDRVEFTIDRSSCNAR
jgi:hypothetical protein